MGTIQKSSEWENRTSVKKGNLGESYVKDFLESKGFVTYQPTTETAHAFDMLAVRKKETVIIAEVKTKALMINWMATGFPQNNYLEYKKIYDKYRIPIFVFFVDEGKGEIYGNWLFEKLERPSVFEKTVFPMVKDFKGGKTRLYHYNQMQLIKKLNEKQIAKLKQYANRKYKYREET